ncbi:hypothetical protein Q7P35_008834 [Cladosporium inversicolor]
MAIRRCTQADADEIAELCARTCSDDPLFGDLLHPKRNEFPDDFIAFFRRRLLNTLAIPSHHHIVTREVIEGRDTITGYAEWARHHAADGDQQDVPAKPDIYCPPINRAADPACADIFQRSAPFSQHFWKGARAEHWMLDLLLVHPAHQRKGLGRKLVFYGVGLADEEGVCASLVASAVGDRLYVSCGFEADIPPIAVNGRFTFPFPCQYRPHSGNNQKLNIRKTTEHGVNILKEQHEQER